jgi:DNA-directed RNA polymerase subunit F
VSVNEDDKKFVTISEVKNILKKIEKQRPELTYEQRIALEHSNKFSKLTNQKSKELIKDLIKLEFIEEIHAYKIVDLIPKSSEDIKTIFAKERLNLDENKIKEIIKLINKYYIE